MRVREKGRGVLAPTPHLSLLEVSKRHYYYYYFGPGHFGWLFGLSQGFALPLKCPELPACGLSAKAAAAPPKYMLSANMSAVINNEMRFFIFSPPPPFGGVAGCATGSARPLSAHLYVGELPSLYLYLYDAATLASADECAMNRRLTSSNSVKRKSNFGEFPFHAL